MMGIIQVKLNQSINQHDYFQLKLCLVLFQLQILLFFKKLKYYKIN
jgi:hypothetical protein